MASVETDERLEAICRLTATIGFAVRLQPAALEWVSSDLEERIGRAAADLWPSGWRELVEQDDLPALDDAIRHVNEGEPVERELRLVNGRTIQLSAYPELDAGDRVTRVYGALRDVTDARERARREAAAAAIARAAFEAPEAEQVMPRVLQAYASALGAAAAAYWGLVDRALHRASIWTAPGAETFYLGPGQMSCDDGSLISRACRTGRPVVIGDVCADDQFLRCAWAKKSGLHGAYAFPVTCGEGVHGVIECFTRAPADPPWALIDALGTSAIHLGRHLRHIRV